MKTKFLIIRFSSIGDIVLTSPVIRCLSTQYEGSEIHFVTKKRNADLLEANPYISKIIHFDESIFKTISLLKAENYDYVIDLHNNIRSLLVKTLLGKKSFTFNKSNLRKTFITTLFFKSLEIEHIVFRSLKTAQKLGVNYDGEGLDYFIPEEDVIKTSDLPIEFKDGYIAWVISGTYFTKKMPVEKMKDFICNTNFPVVILGGKSEINMAEKVMSWGTSNVLNYTGKLNLNQSASLVKNANLVISNDTGLMHIAAAFRKKILSVWGNTSPELGMSPFMPGLASEILEVKGLKCRPCSKLGYKSCPQKHFRCMNDLPEDKILQWVELNFRS